MDAEATVRAYYDALRAGEPIHTFFADGPEVVKFGVGERLTASDEVHAGLRRQTETTTDWVVESDRLLVGEREGFAWFSDDVRMAWTDESAAVRYDFDTRWSGTLVDEGEWRFVEMHVSTADHGSGTPLE